MLHLASPASPPDYLARPLETLAVGSEGTRRVLELAGRHGARFLLASTSEVYGDPAVHPQVETYWGNVNPVGPRSVYDEAKRFAEALTMAHHRALGIDVGIVRIFNTYGPRLRPGDGRVVSNFMRPGARGASPSPSTGTGPRPGACASWTTRWPGSWPCSTPPSPARSTSATPTSAPCSSWPARSSALTGSASAIELRPLPTDDPTRRRPDITLARSGPGLGARSSVWRRAWPGPSPTWRPEAGLAVPADLREDDGADRASAPTRSGRREGRAHA